MKQRDARRSIVSNDVRSAFTYNGAENEVTILGRGELRWEQTAFEMPGAEAVSGRGNLYKVDLLM